MAEGLEPDVRPPTPPQTDARALVTAGQLVDEGQGQCGKTLARVELGNQIGHGRQVGQGDLGLRRAFAPLVEGWHITDQAQMAQRGCCLSLAGRFQIINRHKRGTRRGHMPAHGQRVRLGPGTDAIQGGQGGLALGSGPCRLRRRAQEYWQPWTTRRVCRPGRHMLEDFPRRLSIEQAVPGPGQQGGRLQKQRPERLGWAGKLPKAVQTLQAGFESFGWGTERRDGTCAVHRAAGEASGWAARMAWRCPALPGVMRPSGFSSKIFTLRRPLAGSATGERNATVPVV